jgi:hypothetical protein
MKNGVIFEKKDVREKVEGYNSKATEMNRAD